MEPKKINKPLPLQNRTNNVESARRKRGTNWNEKETRVMLELATEMNINKLMDANRYRHVDIYKGLEKKLEEKGIQKTHEQIKIRLKKLKLSYINCKKDNAPSGAGRSDIPFYDQLDLLFGARPAVECNLDGIDTLEMDQSDIPIVSEACEVETNVFVEEIEPLSSQSEEIRRTPNVIEDNFGNVPSTSKQGTIEDNFGNVPSTSKQGGEEKNKTSGGRYSSNTLLQNFATTVKKNWQEITEKMTRDHEQFMAKEMKKQREWDVKLVRLQLKSQERQTNKLINVLTNLKSQQNKTTAESESSEDLGSADVFDSDLSDL